MNDSELEAAQKAMPIDGYQGGNFYEDAVKGLQGRNDAYRAVENDPPADPNCPLCKGYGIHPSRPLRSCDCRKADASVVAEES